MTKPTLADLKIDWAVGKAVGIEVKRTTSTTPVRKVSDHSKFSPSTCFDDAMEALLLWRNQSKGFNVVAAIDRIALCEVLDRGPIALCEAILATEE